MKQSTHQKSNNKETLASPSGNPTSHYLSDNQYQDDQMKSSLLGKNNKNRALSGTTGTGGVSQQNTQETENDENSQFQQLRQRRMNLEKQSQFTKSEITNEDNSNGQDLRKSPMRWCMLFMACSFMLGNCFCYDNPGPLQTQLQKQFGMDSTRFSLLYTVYSIPNMVLPIFGGIFLDRMGIRPGLLFFSIVLTIGQFVFAIGGYQNSYNTMLVGRIIFGMGGECMGVAQSSIISAWFKGKELAFALGLNLSMSRLGSVANADILPALYDSQGLGPALMLGFGICIFSLFNAFGLVIVDKKAEKTIPDSERAGLSETDKFKWSDLYTFNASYWLLTGSCVVTYMSVFPFIQNASDLLQTKYHFDKITAGYLFGVPYIISAVSSPFLGLLIDKVGKRAFLVCLSSTILIIGFTSSMMMPECHQCYNQAVPLVLTGIGYSIYAAAIWGSIPYVVKSSSVGTAFGITTAIQNIGLVVAPTLVGLIKDATKEIDHGYFWMNMFFIAINIVGLIFNMNLYYIDIYYNNGVLDKVSTDDDDKNEDAQQEEDDDEQADFDVKNSNNKQGVKAQKQLFREHHNNYGGDNDETNSLLSEDKN